MDDALLGIVLGRLDHYRLSDEATDLLLAALDGDESLAGQLREGAAERYVPVSPVTEAENPVRAYLSSVTVAGFRGIGASSTLTVHPGPGLTLIMGRNGSGKSSFAEALEALLTGTVQRFESARTNAERDGWRSKHADGTPEIRAEFLIEGKGQAVVSRSWPNAAGTGSGAEFSQSQAWLQVRGAKRGPIEELGWDVALKGHRPFLAHAELAAFFGTPSAVHDLLASVLGLEDLTAADKRLQFAVKQREDALSAAKKELVQLKGRLQAFGGQDERATAVLAALAATAPAKWDIGAAIAAATGSQVREGPGSLAALRRLAQLDAPPRDTVRATATALRAAAEGLAATAGTSAARAGELARLLEAALGLHESHGDGDCPVCGNPGALTAAWRTATEQHRDRLRAEAAAADDAFKAAEGALHQALDLLRPLPADLAVPDPATSIDLTAVAAAWRHWAAGPWESVSGRRATPEALSALAAHLEGARAVLADAVAALRLAAERELTRRDDRWAPLAAEAASWCTRAEAARAGSQPVSALKAARAWLAGARDDLRDQRLAPLADKSRAVWEQLRQESSVGLGAFRLVGANTNRRLELHVSLDGEDGTALGVMSQGEINALALSVFLPRATMPDSPFRFLVIDDPVQAMDPAKVDGLARVLHEVSKVRQVLVFTHDNRLAAAVKDLEIPATILEVTRQPRSQVTVRPCLDVWDQALDDAAAINADPQVPDAIKERVVPGLCRTAVEAAFAQVYWRRQLRAGWTRAEVEEAIGGSKRLNLNGLAALTIFGTAEDRNNVADELERRWGRNVARLVKDLNKGSHQGYPGDLRNLIDDSRGLVKRIGERLP
jgi:energy-coupling factor transporter ATP-binding protein EcfA2